MEWYRTFSLLESPEGCSCAWLGSLPFLPPADSLQVLTKHTIDVSCEYCLKHPGLDFRVILSSYTFQGTNSVVNYEVDQREDVSVQEVRVTQKPLITLSSSAWRRNKAECMNLPTCLATHQISRETQDCSTWPQVTGKGDEHKEQRHREAALGRPGLSSPASSPTMPLQYMACSSISVAGKPWSHSGHDT